MSFPMAYLTLPSTQLEALYALLDDDGSGSLTIHEMIDLFVRHSIPDPSPKREGPVCPMRAPWSHLPANSWR